LLGFEPLTRPRLLSEQQYLNLNRLKNNLERRGYQGKSVERPSRFDTPELEEQQRSLVRYALIEMVWRLVRWQPDYRPIQKLRRSASSRDKRRLAVPAARRLGTAFAWTRFKIQRRYWQRAIFHQTHTSGGKPPPVFLDACRRYNAAQDAKFGRVASLKLRERFPPPRSECLICSHYPRREILISQMGATPIGGSRVLAGLHAVFSTVGKIRQTLADSGAKGIISVVRYLSPIETIPRPDYDVLERQLLIYWLKSGCSPV
jgi:hypothetical protein